MMPRAWQSEKILSHRVAGSSNGALVIKVKKARLEVKGSKEMTGRARERYISGPGNKLG
jgi:hypothetical protein